jgi:peptide deformylase
MIRKIVKYGHPALRAKGKKITAITDEIRQLACDMLETMESANGVGLAAQQVGVPLQLTVVDVTDAEDRPSSMSIDGKPCDPAEHMPLVLLNPVLTLGRETEPGTEGCLSFPEITAEIVRSIEVTAKAQLIDGSEIEFEAAGLLARALQHEVDHLNGVLFIDRMNSATKAGLAGRLKRMQRENAV